MSDHEDLVDYGLGALLLPSLLHRVKLTTVQRTPAPTRTWYVHTVTHHLPPLPHPITFAAHQPLTQPRRALAEWQSRSLPQPSAR